MIINKAAIKIINSRLQATSNIYSFVYDNSRYTLIRVDDNCISLKNSKNENLLLLSIRAGEVYINKNICETKLKKILDIVI